MSKKDEYFAMMESQIKKWDAEVDKLRAKSGQTSAEARAKYDEQLKAMRAKSRCRLQEVAGNAYGHPGVDAAWASMKNALAELAPGRESPDSKASTTPA